MNVILAKSAGFCFGVKRAVDTVYERILEKEPLYTFGPIIHNEEVVRDLEEKGVVVVNDVDELAGKPQGTVIIRAHGVERGVCEKIQTLGFSIVDATCPFVLKIHRLVERYSGEDCHIVIVGNASHPEVKGIKSWSNAEDTRVIGTREEAEKYDASHGKKVCIVSQTTFNYNKFQELVEIIKEKGYDIIVLNTICNATEERQTQSRALAKEVEAMIVVGGKSSSNTQKLFEICKNECANTYYIQTIDDLDPAVLRTIDNVGITAGASTPNKIIKEVHGRMDEMNFEELLKNEFSDEIELKFRSFLLENYIIALNLGYESDTDILQYFEKELKTIVSADDYNTIKDLYNNKLQIIKEIMDKYNSNEIINSKTKLLCHTNVKPLGLAIYEKIRLIQKSLLVELNKYCIEFNKKNKSKMEIVYFDSDSIYVIVDEEALNTAFDTLTRIMPLAFSNHCPNIVSNCIIEVLH